MEVMQIWEQGRLGHQRVSNKYQILMTNTCHQQEKHDLGNLLETTHVNSLHFSLDNNFYKFLFLKTQLLHPKKKSIFFENPKCTFQFQGSCLSHLSHRFTLTIKILSVYFKQESKQNIEAIFNTQSSNFFAEIIFPLVKSCCTLKGSTHYICGTECLIQKKWKREPSFPWWQD